jgi:DNA polymerase III subunit beta
MFAIVSQQPLLQALQHVTKAVEASSPLPILAGVLLEVYPERLSLTASNTRMRIQVDIPFESSRHTLKRNTGHIVVPARYLLDMIRKLPPGDVTMDTDEQMMMTIRSDSTVCRLCGMDAEEFPAMPRSDQFDCIIQLPNDLLKSTIRQVSFAASVSEARPVLTGVLCRVDAESLHLLATDGIRLASHSLGIQQENVSGSPIQVVIPGKTLAELCKMLDSEAEERTEIAISRNQIRFRNRSFQQLSVLLDGTFPSTDKLIPRSYSTEIILNSTSLLQAIERVCLLAGEEHLVKLTTTSSGGMRLSSVNSQVGDVRAEIPMHSMDGERITIYFNGKYMAEIIRALEGTDVCIRLSGGMSPIVIQLAAAQSPLYLLTPIRHRESLSA